MDKASVQRKLLHYGFCVRKAKAYCRNRALSSLQVSVCIQKTSITAFCIKIIGAHEIAVSKAIPAAFLQLNYYEPM